jgi:hypothetical protein
MIKFLYQHFFKIVCVPRAVLGILGRIKYVDIKMFVGSCSFHIRLNGNLSIYFKKFKMAANMAATQPIM